MSIVRAAAKAIVNNGDKFLVIRQDLPDKTVWDLPGGKIEHGETPQETVLREVKEEVGLEVLVNDVVGVFWFFAGDDTQVICTTFLCTVSDTKVDIANNPADENIGEYRWVTKEDFLSSEYKVGDDSLKDLVSRL